MRRNPKTHTKTCLSMGKDHQGNWVMTFFTNNISVYTRRNMITALKKLRYCIHANGSGTDPIDFAVAQFLLPYAKEWHLACEYIRRAGFLDCQPEPKGPSPAWKKKTEFVKFNRKYSSLGAWSVSADGRTCLTISIVCSMSLRWAFTRSFSSWVKDNEDEDLIYN